MIDYEKMDQKKTLGISLFVVAIVIVSIILQLRAESEIERFGINLMTLIVLVVLLLILTKMKGKKESGKFIILDWPWERLHQMKTEFEISLLVVAAAIISFAFGFQEGSQIELALVIGLAVIATLFGLFRKYKEKKAE